MECKSKEMYYHTADILAPLDVPVRKTLVGAGVVHVPRFYGGCCGIFRLYIKVM